MKAIVNTGPGKLEFLDWPTPQPGPGQVRIRTQACGICATELKMIAGWERTGFPAIPGHEWSGVVDAAGPGVDPAWVGAACVGENVLSGGGEVGFEHPGGYGEFFLTEAANLYRLQEDFPPHLAALIEPLAVCVRASRRLKAGEGTATLDQAVLIFGDGPVGLLMLALLRQDGMPELAVVGGRAERLALAAGLGADRAVLYPADAADPVRALKEILGRKYPFVVEASGSLAAAQAALALALRGGRVVILGDYEGARASFEWNDLLHGEIEITGSNASAGAWPEAVRLALEGRLPLARLVTHRFPASRFTEAIDLVRLQEQGVLKTVLEWD